MSTAKRDCWACRLRPASARRRLAAASDRPAATLIFMRRIALILLMVLLPLQSIWAAAANACPHEQMSAGKHGADLAHEHAHGHADDAASADDVPANTDGNPGSGVGSPCHGQGNAAVIAEDRTTVADSRAGIVPSAYTRFVADRFLESPLRPPVPHDA